MSETDNKLLRIDKWLWAARFYKTRVLASEAVQHGHVHVNGVRVKPSRTLQVGEQLEINKSPFKFLITVLILESRRGSATLARTLYEESDESIAGRETVQEQQRLQVANNPHPDKRPDKRNRRKIIRFVSKQSG